MTTIHSTQQILSTLPSGHELGFTCYEVQGEKPGPHVHIQASVHGSELQGSLVIHYLLEKLKKTTLAGTMTLIPLANPMATDNKISTFTQGRFHPISGENWNRLYFDLGKHLDIDQWCEKHKDLSVKDCVQQYKEDLEATLDRLYKQEEEYGLNGDTFLAYQLQKRSLQADIVLDLHTGPVACHYLYAPEYLQVRARDLHFPFQLIIPHEFAGAMDEASFCPWQQLAQAKEKRGQNFDYIFEAYTLELGSEEVVNSQKAREESDLILHYLSRRGLIEPVDAPLVDIVQRKLEHFKSYYTPGGGLVEYLKKPGDFVSRGEDLYNIYLPSQAHAEKQKTTVKAVKDAHIINHTPSASLQQGVCVYQVLEV